MGYSYATRKSYTRISPLHSKEDCWRFQGVYRLPHPYLTWIQRLLLTIASIPPPTHMLPLVAIVNAPHRRFGGSPLYTTLVTLCDTVAIHKYPCFVALTYSMFLSTLVSRIYTEFLLFGKFSSRAVSTEQSPYLQHRHGEALTWCHKRDFKVS